MEMNFCRRCGTHLASQSPGLYVCENNHRIYNSAYPTANIFLLNEIGDVLVAVRANDPGKGTLDVPGGFVDIGETAEVALAREIQEETGLTPEYYAYPEILCTATSKYDYDGELRPILSTLFWARLHPSANPIANDDVASIKYLPLPSLNSGDFYGEDVRLGIEKLMDLHSRHML